MARKTFLRVRSKIFLLTCALILFVCFFALVPMYFRSVENATRELKSNRVSRMGEVAMKVERAMMEITLVSQLYLNDSTVIRALLSPIDPDSPTAFWEEMRETTQLRQVMANYNWPYNVFGLRFHSYILGDQGKRFSSDNREIPEGLDAIALGRMESKDRRTMWSFQPAAQSKEEEHCLLASSRVVNVYRVGSDPIGVLILMLDERSMYDQYAPQLEHENRIYLVDDTGRILSSNDRGSIGALYASAPLSAGEEGSRAEIVAIGGEEHMVTVVPLAQQGWSVVEEIPTRFVMQPIYASSRYVIVIMLASVAFALLLSYLAGRTMSRPIEVLCGKMNEVAQGNLDIQLPALGNDEIGQLRRSFNHLVVWIRQLIEDIRAQEAQKRDNELKFLLAQINPHFLYNTLNTIRFMVSIGRGEDAENMLMAFMKLLRKTLTTSQPMVPVREELENLEHYVAIEQYRYRENLSVRYQVDGDVRSAMMPKMLLQPLIENAIFHGGEPKGAPYTVTIGIWRQESQLHFSVEDDGIGMTPEALEALRSQTQPDNGERDHIGMQNIRDRLTLRYGADCVLDIRSEPGKGTAVSFRIPYREEGQ